jgi:hypothetical protein
MRYQQTDLPGLVLQDEAAGRGRIAYLAADLDRCFGRDNMPDHADVLANLVRWSASEAIPLEVEGPGLMDCHLYSQEGRLVLHLVNLSNATWRAPVHELLPVGPLSIRVKPPAELGGASVRLLVAGLTASPTTADGMIGFEIESIRDHEIVVIE